MATNSTKQKDKKSENKTLAETLQIVKFEDGQYGLRKELKGEDNYSFAVLSYYWFKSWSKTSTKTGVRHTDLVSMRKARLQIIKDHEHGVIVK